jgi:hypothetical protein
VNVRRRGHGCGVAGVLVNKKVSIGVGVVLGAVHELIGFSLRD